MAVLTAAKKAAAIAVYNTVKLICPKYNLCAAKAITAQAMCESAWNTSSLSKKYFNFFGMKCGSSWKGSSVNLATKEEYTPGVTTNIKANFRTYANLAEGIEGYCKFITGMSRYSNLLGCIDDNLYIERIKADGWATDSQYIKTLKSVMKTCEDNGVFAEETTPSKVSATSSQKFTVGLVYTTTVNLNVRESASTGARILKTYKKGTRFTCKEVRKIADNIWVRTPSGWVAVLYNGKNYAE